jgi:nicotinamide mononucleotide transporter
VNSFFGRFWNDLQSTSPVEVLAVVLGVVYIVLIVRRQRVGWVAGAASSLIYVFIAARARLPMQSALQAYYVAMSVYGWWSWTRNRSEEQGRIDSRSLRWHLWAVAIIVVASAACAQLLARETHAAWPLLDSLTTMMSLLATWMVARSVLQNWLYWMVADLVMVFLFVQQGHPFTSLLFAIYFVIAAFGYRKWHSLRRQQVVSA